MGGQLQDATGARGGVLTRREGLMFLALLVLAAVIRVISWFRTAVMFDDGPLFIYIAEAMRDGHWLSVLQHSYHPLYSMSIWWGGATGLDLETVAGGLSIGFGVLGVGLLYGFLRDTFGPRVAWLGAALLAIHPRAVTFTSDVQSDGLYMALFVAAMWAVWRSLAPASSKHRGTCGPACRSCVLDASRRLRPRTDCGLGRSPFVLSRQLGVASRSRLRGDAGPGCCRGRVPLLDGAERGHWRMATDAEEVDL